MAYLQPSRPFRSFRRGCCGCVVALVLALALLGCGVFFGVGRWVRPAEAAPPDGPRAAQLVGAIAEGAPVARAQGSFWEGRVTVEVVGGAVRLASTTDGLGALVTDDRATLTVTRPDGSQAIWARDFRSADRARVVALPAQDVTALFQPGRNEVTLRLEDLWPPTHSSAPYFLVLLPDEARAARLGEARMDGAATASLPPTRTRVTTVASATAARPTATALGVGALATATPAPRQTTVATILAASDASAGAAVAPPSDEPGVSLVEGLVALGGAVALLVVVGRRLGAGPRRTAAAMTGWLSLWDAETGEALPMVSLATFAGGAQIVVGPLRLVDATNDGGVATLHPAPDGGVTLQVNAEPSPEVAPTAGALPLEILLRDGDRWDGGRVTVEYRNPLGRPLNVER